MFTDLTNILIATMLLLVLRTVLRLVHTQKVQSSAPVLCF